MDAATGQQWFLRKHEDGSVFGPLDFEQLSDWAATARVAPADSISADQITWSKAPMLPELGMDWLVEITSERYYGPTTVGAVHEFVRLGEITTDTTLINTCDGTRHKVAALEPETISQIIYEVTDAMPSPSPIAIDVADRIRDLEQSLAEERRALRESEERYRMLEIRYRELLEQTASDGTLR